MQPNNPYQAPSAEFNAGSGLESSDETPVYSPAGRFGRLSYLAWCAVASLATGFLMFFLSLLIALVGFQGTAEPEALSPGLVALVYLAMIPMLVFMVIFMIRRLHDLNLSGWWSLLCLAPLINFVFGLIIAVMPGTSGENNFGPPRETRSWEQIIALIYIAMCALGLVAYGMIFAALVL